MSAVNIKDNIEEVEKIVINYLVTSDDEYYLTDENNNSVDRIKLLKSLNKRFFTHETIVRVFEILAEHINAYGQMPNVLEIKNIIKVKGYAIDDEEIDVLFSYDLKSYNKKRIYKQIKAFVAVKRLDLGLMQMMAHAKSTPVDPDNIDELYENIRTKINGVFDIELSDESKGLDVLDPTSHIQPIRSTRSTGFPFLDKVLGGGWEKKTFICFAGRPKVGKSLILSNLAVRAYMSKANVGLMTVELGDRKYVKRLGSNLLNISGKEYKKFKDKESIDIVKKRIKEYSDKSGNDAVFHLKELPTGSPTSIDIENYFLKIESSMNIKFDLIVIDYLNLLRPFKQGNTLYEKIKAIAEELRAIAIRNNWTIVSATQVKVADYNSDLRLDSAAESSGLIATVDSFFGIMGEPGGDTVTIKNIANRDEGYMESYKVYHKVMDYFRIREAVGPDSEYWSDEPDTLEKEVVETYKDLKDPMLEPKSEGGGLDDLKYSVEPIPDNDNSMEPNNDFDITGADDIDYDDILNNVE